MPRVEPLAVLQGVRTRSLLFAPDGDLVFRRDHATWIRWRRAAAVEERLPVTGGRAAFFGRWLLIHDPEGDQSHAIDWSSPTSVRPCEMGFDRGMQELDPALVATTSGSAALVRNRHLYTRAGAPDTIEDGAGWVHRGTFDLNLRLVCPHDGRFVFGCGYGPPFSVLDTDTGEARKLAVEVQGHPTWAAGHPRAHTVAVFSRALDLVDVEYGHVERILHLPSKLTGDYLPDGRLVISSDLGVMLWDAPRGQPRFILDAPPGPLDEQLALRVCPAGRTLAVPQADGRIALHDAAALGCGPRAEPEVTG